jgi:phage tail sheath protein FI
MPVTVTYPGIYIQEAPSSSHTITAAPTNIAVFIGYTHPLKTAPGLLGQAQQIFGFADYQSQYGGFVRSGAFTRAYGVANNQGAFGDMGQAVNQFFLNGGATAYIVALPNQTLNALSPSVVTLGPAGSPPSSPPVGGWVLGRLASGATAPSNALTFTAIEVTDELYAMAITIRPGQTTSPPGNQVADIIISYGPVNPAASASPPASPVATGPGTTIETYRRVSLNPFLSDGVTANPNYITTRLSASALVTVALGAAATSPAWPAGITTQVFASYLPQNTPFFSPNDYTAVLQENTPLDKVPIFNLMVLPGIADNSATWPADESGVLILATAIAFCERKLAFLIMDPPIADSADGTVKPAAWPPLPSPTPAPPGDVSNPIQATINQGSIPESKNAALYFPYLLSPDPITGSGVNYVTGQPSQMPPAATVCGLYAATDLSRGVWKAPAGFQTQANNVTGVVLRGVMTDPRQGVLNPLGVNCLRQFPNVGTVVFGARTLVTLTDEQWRYVPVKRTALFIEQSLLASLKWVIFEPNAQPLWSAISMSINAFMLGLFKQGAFQGDTPSEAFLVQCDSQTTTQTDIDNGIVNIVVGFAPLKPAEFVVITIAQLAGQTQTS